MKKEEILAMSKKENQGKPDEREIGVYGKASRVGMAVGGLICVALVIVGRFLFDMPELSLSAWMVYFGMYGSNDIALYVHLKKKTHLAQGIFYSVLSILFAVAVVVLSKG